MGAVHQSGDSAVNKTIRPLPGNGSARSIISAGPGDGRRNAVIDGSVRPSNLSADTEGLNNHERNEDRHPRRRTPPVPPPAEESIKMLSAPVASGVLRDGRRSPWKPDDPHVDYNSTKV
ncbi:hypothetical protein QQF64_012700 [Cirrhinus molitorella]|uniref:Uncharacterized protein n=1 Tax=Cirrhinus molitorella TaxID=172907 RepID=A0ABR3LXX4_9TELE